MPSFEVVPCGSSGVKYVICPFVSGASVMIKSLKRVVLASPKRCWDVLRCVAMREMKSSALVEAVFSMSSKSHNTVFSEAEALDGILKALIISSKRFGFRSMSSFIALA